MSAEYVISGLITLALLVYLTSHCSDQRSSKCDRRDSRCQPEARNSRASAVTLSAARLGKPTAHKGVHRGYRYLTP